MLKPFVELIEQRSGCLFRGIKSQELLQDFSSFFRFLSGDQAPCQTTPSRIEMGIVALFAGQLTAKVLRQNLQSLLVRKSEVALGESDIFILQRQFGQL